MAQIYCTEYVSSELLNRLLPEKGLQNSKLEKAFAFFLMLQMMQLHILRSFLLADYSQRLPFFLWLIIAAAFAATLVVSANIGLALGVMLDGPARGAMALHHIAAIEAGKTKNTRVALEHDVDMGLLWGYQFQQEPLRTFVKYFTHYPLDSYDNYMRRLANYRLKIPSPMRADALPKEPVPDTPERRAFF